MPSSPSRQPSASLKRPAADPDPGEACASGQRRKVDPTAPNPNGQPAAATIFYGKVVRAAPVQIEDSNGRVKTETEKTTGEMAVIGLDSQLSACVLVLYFKRERGLPQVSQRLLAKRDDQAGAGGASSSGQAYVVEHGFGKMKFQMVVGASGCELKGTGALAPGASGTSSTAKLQFRLQVKRGSRHDPNRTARVRYVQLERELEAFTSQDISPVGNSGGAVAGGNSVRAMMNVTNQLRTILPKPPAALPQQSHAAPAYGARFGTGGGGASSSSSSSSSSAAGGISLGETGSREARRVCVIGATGTGKSSLVNALLGNNLAVSAGKGAAVTSVPTEFYYRPPAASTVVNPTEFQGGRDLVGEGLLSSGLVPAALRQPPAFAVTLKFLGYAQLLSLVVDTIDDLYSPQVTKTEKDRECKPLLTLLFGASFAANYEWAREVDDQTNPQMLETRRAQTQRGMKGLLMVQKHSPRPAMSSGSVLDLAKNPQSQTAYLLMGKTLTSQVYTLDTLRRLENDYWRIIEHVAIGGDFPLLNLPGCALRLVDVPGFGDECGLREKIAEKYLHKADKILICAASARAGSDRQTKEYLQKDAVQQLQMKNVGRNTTVFVATKSDHAPPSELQELDELEDDFSELHRLYRESVRKNVQKMLADFKYGHDIPVHVVSSEKYLALAGLSTNDANGSAFEDTGVPELSASLFRSLWADVNLPAHKRLQELLTYSQERADALEKQQGDGGEGDPEQSSSGQQLSEAIREVFEQAAARIKQDEKRLMAVLKELENEIANLQKHIEKAARAANAATPSCVAEWARLHWGTYKATLRKGGEHNGVKGLSDFHSDLFRKFRETLQDEGWSDFFSKWQDQLRKFDTACEEIWVTIMDEIISSVYAEDSPVRSVSTETQRQQIASEIRKRGRTVDVKTYVGPILEPLRRQIEAVQDELDAPKQALKERYAGEYTEIGNSESGTGSHARRKEKVSTALSGGCKMAENSQEILDSAKQAQADCARLPPKVDDALWAQAKKYFARGSWSADLSECCICLEKGGKKTWSLIFHCQHAFHTSCLEAHLQRSNECPQCRGPVDRNLLEIVSAKQDDEAEPPGVVSAVVGKIKRIAEETKDILRKRGILSKSAAEEEGEAGMEQGARE